MITLNQITSILAERVGRQYDLIFKTELKTIVEYWRGTILRQALKENPRDISYFSKSFQVELVDDYIVKCPFNYGCVKRTKEPLPQMIRNTQTPFQFVGDSDLEESYTFIFPFQLKSISYGRNLKKKQYYTILDGYGLFFGLPKSQEWVGFTGIPQNVDDLKKFKRCGDNNIPCYSDDTEYPLTADLVQRVIQAILSTELKNQVIKPHDEVELNGSN